MNQNGKVMARIEYGEGETQKVCYGEIEEKKIKNFCSGEDSFICVENDGIIMWLDKESLISVEMLSVQKTLLLKPKITDYSGLKSKTDKDTGICI